MFLITAAILLGILIILTLAELLLRATLKYILGYDSSIIFDPQLGWRLRPNLKGARKWTDEFKYQVFTDALGFRVGRHHSGTPDKCDLLLLGDSFCFGEGVDFEDSVAGLLIRNHPGVRVINTAVSNYGTDQQFLMLRRMINSLSVGGIVLLMTYLNDFDEILRRSNGAMPKPWCEFRGTNFVLHEPTSLLDRVCGTFRQLLRFAGLARTWLGISAPPQYAYNVMAARIYRELVRLMAEIISGAGGRFVIAYTTGKQANSSEALAWGNLVERCARECSATFVNLDENPQGSGVYFKKDIHWTPLGNEINYRYLVSQLFGPPAEANAGILLTQSRSASAQTLLESEVGDS